MDFIQDQQQAPPKAPSERLGGQAAPPVFPSDEESAVKRIWREFKIPFIIGVAVLVLMILGALVLRAWRERGGEVELASPAPPAGGVVAPVKKPLLQPSGRKELSAAERKNWGVRDDAKAEWIEYPNGFRALKIDDPNAPPPVVDMDGDGLGDKKEAELKTNPAVVDTDGDGLGDGLEVLQLKTDPLKKDTDGDGKSDAQELVGKSDPLKR